MTQRMKWTGSDDQFFEVLTKVVFYTGFSRKVVESRWPAFQTAFSSFRIDEVLSYDAVMVEQLLQHDSHIVRNARKVHATIKNAGVCRELSQLHGSMADYCARLVDIGEDQGVKLLQESFYLIGESAARSLWKELFFPGGSGEDFSRSMTMYYVSR